MHLDKRTANVEVEAMPVVTQSVGCQGLRRMGNWWTDGEGV